MSTDHRFLYIALAVLVVLLLIGPLMMGTMMGPGVMMGPGMMGGPWGQGGQPNPNVPGWMWGLGMGFGWLAMIAFWGVLIVGLVLVVRWLSGAAPHSSTTESAQDILKQRYARGEIDQPTFERMMRELA